MLEVIGAGFPRTGTSSMKAALERLGFGPCFHMFDVMTKPGIAERWAPLAGDAQPDWARVFDGYRSSQDWPASHFYRSQAEAFPDAKVVLTVRDPHAWYVSMGTLMAEGPGRELPPDLPEAAAAVFGRMDLITPLLTEIGRDVFGLDDWTFTDGMPEEKVALAAFERHVDKARASLPADRLLVFDVREGWEPLCRFLRRDVPDEPFPHLNDAKAMAATLDRLVREGVIEPR
ncbi:sulfotransferase family protein [Nonomuraea sp. NPDC049725]|uniref:sulfotransferase family protein n=1 Tax=Nonomuraea sp. NPDC049725 TaxID=3154508 RepID=UPI00341737AB